MAIDSESLLTAIQLHSAGQLSAAEKIYRDVLSADPEQTDAWHLLGVIAHQQGDPALAVQYITRAIELNGAEPGFYSNLGNAYQAQGQFEKAAACFHRAIELNPIFAEAHCNLGGVYLAQSKLDEAFACFSRAVQLCPDDARAYNGLGSVVLAQCQTERATPAYESALESRPANAETCSNLSIALKENHNIDLAVAHFRRAIALKPELAEAHNHLGNALKATKQLHEAAACYRRALELKPSFAEAYSNLGNVLQDLEKLDEAVFCYQKALELQPSLSRALYNLGNTLEKQGRSDEAVDCLRKAIQIEPNFPEAHFNLATIFHAQLKSKESIHCYQRALHLRPGYADAHQAYSMLLLQHGDFERGWPEYEWRLKSQCSSDARATSQPFWNGERLGQEQAVLLRIDQGIGDAFQFSRYASLVKQSAGKVLMHCPRKLIPLLSSCPGVDQFIPDDTELPFFDYHAYLTSLPLVFGTTLETIPRQTPYLFAGSKLVEQWRSRLPAGAFRVGIAWQGNPGFKQDKTRSIPLAHFQQLATATDVALISLQQGYGVDQLHGRKGRFPIVELPSDCDEAAGAFMDTAAIMMNLDLIITSDTAIAHLAGALGVPVWVALSYCPEWRWLLDRSDSPWYPTMRLFRQSKPGNWTDVFQQIKSTLSDHVGARYRVARIKV
jgi:tetratricopeptide (TPR) repeat protein